MFSFHSPWGEHYVQLLAFATNNKVGQGKYANEIT